jgi:hypothetical protein
MNIKRKQNMYHTQLDYIKILIEDDNKKEAYNNLIKVLHNLEEEIKTETTNEEQKEHC